MDVAADVTGHHGGMRVLMGRGHGAFSPHSGHLRPSRHKKNNKGRCKSVGPRRH